MKVRDPLLVKIFCGRRLQPEALRAEVESHRLEHEKTLQLYRVLHEQMGKLPAAVRQRYHHPLLTLKLGIRFEVAWLAWCDEVMGEL